jgi:predicted transcriptional regulator
MYYDGVIHAEVQVPLSVRLDSKTENVVKRLARERNQTRSHVIREAIAAFERDQTTESRSAPGPWEALAHLVGVADSGGQRLSERTGDRFTVLLRTKARARRTR